MIHSALQRLAMWLVWHGPYLGKFAPILFDFAMGQKGKRITADTEGGK